MASRGPSRVSGPIVDASVVLSWSFDDEESATADAAMEMVSRDGGVIPQHWHYEVGNGLATAVRRRRLAAEDAFQRLRSLNRFHWTTDTSSDLEMVLQLAIEHELTLYDALYLELAVRRQLHLVTLDGDLARASRALGLEAPHI